MLVAGALKSAGLRVTAGTDVVALQAVVSMFSRDILRVLSSLAHRHRAPHWVHSAERSPVLFTVRNAVYVFRLCDGLLRDTDVGAVQPDERVRVFESWFGRPVVGKVAWAAFDMFWNTTIALCDRGGIFLTSDETPDARAVYCRVQGIHESAVIGVPYFHDKKQFGCPIGLEHPLAVHDLSDALTHESRHVLDVPAYGLAHPGFDPRLSSSEVQAYAGEAAEAMTVTFEKDMLGIQLADKTRDRAKSRYHKSRLAWLFSDLVNFKHMFVQSLNRGFYEAVYRPTTRSAAVDSAREELRAVISATFNSLKAKYTAEIRGF